MTSPTSEAPGAPVLPVSAQRGVTDVSSPPATPKPDRRPEPIPTAWPVRSSPAAHPWAIISAGLAPMLLTGAYLTAGILQPASYSPVRATISAMAGRARQRRHVWGGTRAAAAAALHVAAAVCAGGTLPPAAWAPPAVGAEPGPGCEVNVRRSAGVTSAPRAGRPRWACPPTCGRAPPLPRSRHR